MEKFIYQNKALFNLCLLLNLIYTATSQSNIGVFLSTTATVYLPHPTDLAKFLGGTYIKKVRMYEDVHYLIPMSDIDVSVMVDIPNNEDIPYMAKAEGNCKHLADMITTFNLQKQVHMFIVGNQVFDSGKQDIIDNLVPAMKNLQSALDTAGFRGKIKVSTLLSTHVLTSSDIPSNAAFKPAYFSVIKPLLKFLSDNDSPFLLSTFPYYDYVANPTPQIFKLCMFQPNSGRVDPRTGLNYTNMFAIKVDSLRNALNGLQYGDVEIVVAETGWPSYGDENELGANMENSRLYNANLVHYLRSKVGTPLMPRKPVDTYIYTLFDDNSIDGNLTMKSCGIAHPDLTWRYDILLDKKRH